MTAAAASVIPATSLADIERGDGVHYCPMEIPELGTEEGAFKAERLVGLRLRRARNKASRHDCTVRVVKLNGEWLPVTDDLQPNRINVKVDDERITGIQSIG